MTALKTTVLIRKAASGGTVTKKLQANVPDFNLRALAMARYDNP